MSNSIEAISLAISQRLNFPHHRTGDRITWTYYNATSKLKVKHLHYDLYFEEESVGLYVFGILSGMYPYADPQCIDQIVERCNGTQ